MLQPQVMFGMPPLKTRGKADEQKEKLEAFEHQ